jgi:hypothetical protein
VAEYEVFGHYKQEIQAIYIIPLWKIDSFVPQLLLRMNDSLDVLSAQEQLFSLVAAFWLSCGIA